MAKLHPTKEWFHQERGLDPETLDHFGVNLGPPKTNCPWFENGDVILPYSNGEKCRRDPLVKLAPDDKRPRFSFTKGVTPELFNVADASKKVIFLVEGETDTMRLWQELNREGKTDTTGVVGLSGINTWRKELADMISAETVYVILDNDEDYMVVSTVDATWREIRADLGLSRAKRLRLPDGVKDVCEFFDMADMETLRMLAAKANIKKSRYRPLDLRQAPPPPNWLLEDLVSMGDVTLEVGPPGIGKSWVTLGLAVAIAQGWEHFLGRALKQDGRVLYVDSENPLDVVLNRLRRLGLDEDGFGNMRYLWNSGIRLDRDPTTFLDEAIDYEPTLIVLDSLTRLHTQDENNAGAMAALVNDSIQPLARSTGAAVMLIHHDNKGGNPRGSSDIMASVDAALQARSMGENNPGTFMLTQIKSRRRLHGDGLVVSILDDDLTDSVTLKADQPVNPPF